MLISIAVTALYQTYETKMPIWLIVFIAYGLLAVTEYKESKNVRPN